MVLPGLLFVFPQSMLAAPSLALPYADYPRGARIAVYLPTDAAADERFQHVHHTSFEHLQRIDGMGWLQAAICHFQLGHGAARQTHLVAFGYAINVFNNALQAERAANDVRLRAKSFQLAHIRARQYLAADAHVSLDFVFFTYGSIEVESYYKHIEAAPAPLPTTTPTPSPTAILTP